MKAPGRCPRHAAFEPQFRIARRVFNRPSGGGFGLFEPAQHVQRVPKHLLRPTVSRFQADGALEGDRRRLVVVAARQDLAAQGVERPELRRERLDTDEVGQCAFRVAQRPAGLGSPPPGVDEARVGLREPIGQRPDAFERAGVERGVDGAADGDLAFARLQNGRRRDWGGRRVAGSDVNQRGRTRRLVVERRHRP